MSLSLPQRIQYDRYLDCKKRTKKKTGLKVDENKFFDDERLIYFLLDNSSITQHNNERAFSKVCDAVQLACKQLCPGKWCTRSHCENWRSSHAYNCTTTRPSVCKIYKAYIEKQKAKEERVRP